MDALKELAASDQDLALDIRAMEDMLARAPTLAWGFAQETAHRISQSIEWVSVGEIDDDFKREIAALKDSSPSIREPSPSIGCVTVCSSLR